MNKNNNNNNNDNNKELFYDFVNEIGLTFTSEEQNDIDKYASILGDEFFVKFVARCIDNPIKYSSAKQDILDYMFNCAVRKTAFKYKVLMEIPMKKNQVDDSIGNLFQLKK